MKVKVLAIVVTYNRLNYLKRLLENLNSQDRKIDEILIINNNSTDGTIEYLQNSKLNFINQENLGSAGGWHTGINYALKKNYQYVWMMDDDGFPDKKSLKILLENVTDKHACISSVVLKEDSINELVFPIPRLNLYQNPIIFSLFRKYKRLSSLKKKFKDTYNFVHLFNGSLIRINSIKLIGNINTKYVLYGDEVDYFYRMRKVGKVETCLSAYHYHPDVSKRIISSNSAYYYLRNSIIINYKYCDQATLRSILNFFVLIYRLVVRNGIYYTFLNIFKYRKNFFINAIIDAKKKRLGKF